MRSENLPSFASFAIRDIGKHMPSLYYFGNNFSGISYSVFVSSDFYFLSFLIEFISRLRVYGGFDGADFGF